MYSRKGIKYFIIKEAVSWPRNGPGKKVKTTDGHFSQKELLTNGSNLFYTTRSWRLVLLCASLV